MLRTGILGLLSLSAVWAGDWLNWRGPHFNGVADGDAPTEWSDTKNVAWKIPIAGRGFSTPVIAGKRIFLTTAIPKTDAAGEHKFVIMALDRDTGKVLWERTAIEAVPHERYHQRYGSYASYAPITDGKHVWAMFGSWGLYCYDLEGKLVWKKELPKMRMRNAFGEGGGPAIAGERMILMLDQEAGSFITALDKNTGKELWRKDRDEVSTWSTPLVINDLVVVSATNKVRAYNIANGEVVWECGGLGVNVIPMPVVADNLVIVMSGFRSPNLLAIQLGGKGDLTGTDAVVWSNQRGNSYTAAPVVHAGILYNVTDNGMLNAVRASNGEIFYRQQRLPKAYNFKASPVAANGKLYLATEEGDVVIVKLGEKYEVVATNTLTDQFFVASPVIVDGALYLRSATTLYCIRTQ
ncbi:MAG: PQQ-like beta-propeller repeat protein [Bryobacterales bacterium]|nr:PQQ-like beta-propeller repeat protein [Bryobacterales bacterium]